MRLRISDLTDAGIPVCGTLSSAAVNARIREGSAPPEEKTKGRAINDPLADSNEADADILFLEDITVEMHARRNAGGAEISGTLSGRYQQGCGRCAKSLARELDLSTTFLIKQRTRPDEIDDLGILYFSGDSIDLEGPLQETVLLSLSLYWSPEVDENSGVCRGCDRVVQGGMRQSEDKIPGQIGNTVTSSAKRGGAGVSLGDLLKKLS